MEHRLIVVKTNRLKHFLNMPHKYRTVVLIIILYFSILSGCTSDEQQSNLSNIFETVTPTATVDPSGYQAVAPRSCLVNELNTLQSEQKRSGTTTWLQGNLLAWRPGGKKAEGELAYIVPGDRSSWFTGTLTLARGSKFTSQITLAPGTLVNGDLTWSPNGTWLAFIAFRPNEGLYTVMAVRADGSGLIDLFPTDLARNDNRSSQKAIIGWLNDSIVQVMVSCGEECRQAFDINVIETSQFVLTPTVVKDYTLLKKYLQISQDGMTITPAAYPKNMVTAKWSPDKRLVAYLDRRGILWMLSEEEKNNYILDLGLRDVYEIQWSSASDTLAVRAEDKIFVFEIPCRSN